MIRSITANQILRIGAELGEGPIWIRDALWFVDIKRKRIFRFEPGARGSTCWETPELVGWVVPTDTDRLLVGLQSGPHLFDVRRNRFDRLATIDGDFAANRLNDAAVDPSGRVWFGTMDNAEAASNGRLYCWTGAEVVDTGVDPTVITNGPAIAPLGDRLYHVDTLGRRVIRFSVAADGKLGEGSVFLTFDDLDGFPDGATCDAEGGIWVGFYGGWAARRYSPEGRLTTTVRFPVANVTKIALGGPDGRTAWATTARQGLSETSLAMQPMAGDLFTFPVDVPAAPACLARVANEA